MLMGVQRGQDDNQMSSLSIAIHKF